MGKNKTGKKSKKSNINKNSTNSKDLKELGNKAFSNKNYEEAIQWYTKAIENAAEDDDEIHIYYSNRSASFYEQQNYKQALEDANE
jgi:stress-induced-phosphoprotein 1